MSSLASWDKMPCGGLETSLRRDDIERKFKAFMARRGRNPEHSIAEQLYGDATFEVTSCMTCGAQVKLNRGGKRYRTLSGTSDEQVEIPIAPLCSKCAGR